MMKTDQERFAEIASDVKKATREKAKMELEEIKALKCELARERRAEEKGKIKVRKEKRATFYYGLATLFMASVGIPMLITDQIINWYGVFGGTFLTIFFAYLGNKELNY